jgi:hypothetical protein
MYITQCSTSNSDPQSNAALIPAAMNATLHRFPSSSIQRRMNDSRRESNASSLTGGSNQCPVKSLPILLKNPKNLVSSQPEGVAHQNRHQSIVLTPFSSLSSE